MGSPPLRSWPPCNISGAAFRGVEMQWQGAVSLPCLFWGGSLAFGGVHPAWWGVGYWGAPLDLGEPPHNVSGAAFRGAEASSCRVWCPYPIFWGVPSLLGGPCPTWGGGFGHWRAPLDFGDPPSPMSYPPNITAVAFRGAASLGVWDQAVGGCHVSPPPKPPGFGGSFQSPPSPFRGAGGTRGGTLSPASPPTP